MTQETEQQPVGSQAQLIQEYVDKFVAKYGKTLRFRTDAHVMAAQNALRPGEKVHYAWVGKIMAGAGKDTAVFVLTDKNILIGMKGWVGSSSQSIKIENIQNVAESQSMMYGELAIQTIRGTYHLTGLDKNSVPEIKGKILEAMERVEDQNADTQGGQETVRLLKKLVNINLRGQLAEGIINKEQFDKELEK